VIFTLDRRPCFALLDEAMDGIAPDVQTAAYHELR
jgi:hypothetical protein